MAGLLKAEADFDEDTEGELEADRLDDNKVDDTDEGDVVDEPVVKDEFEVGDVLEEGDGTVNNDKLDEAVEFADEERLCVEVKLVEITEVDPVVVLLIEETVDVIFVDKVADKDELAYEIALDVVAETLCDEEDATDNEEGDTEFVEYPFEVSLYDPDSAKLMLGEIDTDEVETSEDVVILEEESKDDAKDDPLDNKEAVIEGEYICIRKRVSSRL